MMNMHPSFLYATIFLSSLFMTTHAAKTRVDVTRGENYHVYSNIYSISCGESTRFESPDMAKRVFLGSIFHHYGRFGAEMKLFNNNVAGDPIIRKAIISKTTFVPFPSTNDTVSYVIWTPGAQFAFLVQMNVDKFLRMTWAYQMPSVDMLKYPLRRMTPPMTAQDRLSSKRALRKIMLIASISRNADAFYKHFSSFKKQARIVKVKIPPTYTRVITPPSILPSPEYYLAGRIGRGGVCDVILPPLHTDRLAALPIVISENKHGYAMLLVTSTEFFESVKPGRAKTHSIDMQLLERF